MGAGKVGAKSKTTGMKLDAANEKVVLVLGEEAAGGEIPIPMHHFVKEGKSTGMFEELLGSTELMLGRDALPGEGKPFTQGHRQRLEAYCSSGGSHRQEIHRALALSEIEAIKRENKELMREMEALTGRGDWQEDEDEKELLNHC